MIVVLVGTEHAGVEYKIGNLGPGVNCDIERAAMRRDRTAVLLELRIGMPTAGGNDLPTARIDRSPTLAAGFKVILENKRKIGSFRKTD